MEWHPLTGGAFLFGSMRLSDKGNENFPWVPFYVQILSSHAILTLFSLRKRGHIVIGWFYVLVQVGWEIG